MIKKLLLLLLLSLAFIGSANADSTDAFVDKTYSITKKDGSAFCQYTIDILVTEELLEQEFHTVNLDFDLTQNDGFIMQTYWSPDSKRSWILLTNSVSPMMNWNNFRFVGMKKTLLKKLEKFFVKLSGRHNTISLPIFSYETSLVDADGSSWIRIVLFTPQSCQ